MSASTTRRSSGEWVWQFTATVIKRSWHCLPSCSGRRGRKEEEGRGEEEREGGEEERKREYIGGWEKRRE